MKKTFAFSLLDKSQIKFYIYVLEKNALQNSF